MVLISLSFSLLALVAGMYLLDKTRKESLGKFFGFISWLVIIVSLLILVCTLTQGGMHMRGGHHMESYMENCHPGMMGEGDCCMPMRGHHRGMMREDCCEEMTGHGGMKGKCCEDDEDDDEDMDNGHCGGMEKGMHKEIHKEIRVEKDTLKK